MSDLIATPIMSEKIDELVKALVEAQKKIKPLKKEGKVDYMFDGKKTKYAVATYTQMWNMAHDALCENGLTFSAVPVGENIWGMMMHSSGQYLGGYLTSKIAKSKYNKYDPQDVGEWVTYMSKYLFKASLNLPTDDDTDATGMKGGAKRDEVARDTDKVKIDKANTTSGDYPLYVSLSKAEGVNMDVKTVKTFLATKGYKTVEDIKKAGKTSDESKAIILKILRGEE